MVENIVLKTAELGHYLRRHIDHRSFLLSLPVPFNLNSFITTPPPLLMTFPYVCTQHLHSMLDESILVAGNLEHISQASNSQNVLLKKEKKAGAPLRLFVFLVSADGWRDPPGLQLHYSYMFVCAASKDCGPGEGGKITQDQNQNQNENYTRV